MYTVILVDDEPWGLKGLENIVNWEDYGFEVIGTYSSGVQLMQEIENLKPDVVFTDYRMAGMDGIELIGKLHSRNEGIQFVIVSAYADFEIAKKALYYDACNYILKPLQRKEIVETLAKLSNKLQKETDGSLVIEVDLDDLNTTLPKELGLLARRSIGRPYASVIIGDQAKELEKKSINLPDKVTLTPIKIKSIGNGVIVTSSTDNAVHVGKLIDYDMSFPGISRYHKGFDNFAKMCHEAIVSSNCGFSYSENKIVGDVQYYIGQNIHRKISIKELASAFFINESYLCEIFKQYTKLTIISFINRSKLNYASILLKDTELSIKEIAHAVGITDTSYLGKLFKRRFGMTMDEYRKSLIPQGDISV